MSTVLVRPRPAATTHPTAGRRFGYVVAIAINVGMIYVMRHLLAWGWPAFLTASYDELLPIITLSLAVTIVANVLFLVADPPWFKSLANSILAAIAFVVAVRTFQLFPFDFSIYDHDWSGLVRFALILTMVGSAIGCVVEAINVVTWPMRRPPRDS